MYFVIALMLCALGTSAQATTPREVIFSEIMWMGSTSSSADEWVELYNRSEAEIDLAGWTIARLTNDGEEIMLLIPEGKIPARATFLIANYPSDDSRSRLNIQPQLVDAAVALANTKLQLRLYNGIPDEGGELIDVADDGKGAPLAGDNDLKQAMVRVLLDQDGTLSTSWSTAKMASGWDEEAAERGTPGLIPDYLQTGRSIEQSTSTQVQPTAWAQIKSDPIFDGLVKSFLADFGFRVADGRFSRAHPLPGFEKALPRPVGGQ